MTMYSLLGFYGMYRLFEFRVCRCQQDNIIPAAVER